MLDFDYIRERRHIVMAKMAETIETAKMWKGFSKKIIVPHLHLVRGL